MKNWDAADETGLCSMENDWKDAQIVCDKLQIPIQKVDFVKQYWIDVFGCVFADRSNHFGTQKYLVATEMPTRKRDYFSFQRVTFAVKSKWYCS